MKNRAKLIGLLLISAALAAVLYIFLHELGHCIVAVACGAHITDFSILTAHMSSTGGNYTDFSKMWLNVNGFLFPLILSYVYMILYQKQVTNSFYRIFSYFVAVITTCSAFAWVFVPILFMNGNAPIGDDCTNFLEFFSTKYNPVLVIVGALLLIALSVILMIKKGIIQNFIALTKSNNKYGLEERNEQNESSSTK